MIVVGLRVVRHSGPAIGMQILSNEPA